MNNLKKEIIKLICLILIIITPFIVFISISENIDNQYDNTYLGEFNDKYNLL